MLTFLEKQAIGSILDACHDVIFIYFIMFY